jgi:hypothetical protein
VRHRRRWYTFLYPKDIRTRYVSEIEALTEELLSDATVRRRSLVLDLVVSGFRARIRQWRTHKWLVPALAVCAITAGLLLSMKTSPPSRFRPAASSQQRIIQGVPPQQCRETVPVATSPVYLCYVVLNPKTGATESAKLVRLTSQQADCLRSGRSGQSVMSCLPTRQHDPNR